MNSLIEYKLRKYIYLGHQYSMYVVPSIRSTFWPKKYQDDVTGVQIIGSIVKKNQLAEINSIVPVILKVRHHQWSLFNFCIPIYLHIMFFIFR